MTIPHVPAYEHWMLLALDRKENDNALRISEALRRHRFYISLPLGGRILNLRWTLEAPDEILPQPVVLQRQGLLNRYPAVAELSQVVGQLRAELTSLPLEVTDPEVQKKKSDLQHQIAVASESLEQIVEIMALSREPSEPVFPPNTDVTLVQQRLDAGATSTGVRVHSKCHLRIHVESGRVFSTWKMESPTKIKTDVAKMLREMGQYDRNQPLGLKELSSEAWKATAAEILSELTADAPADAWDEFEELIIVPDGMLWYVPFEALQIQKGDESVSVVEKVRVRYAPTISLAVPDKRPRPRIMRTAVVAGTVFPREGEELSQELLEDLKADDPNVFGVSVKPPPTSAILAKTVGRLLVLSDVDNDVKGPYDWAPMTVDRGKSGRQSGAMDEAAVGWSRRGTIAWIPHARRERPEARRYRRGNVPGRVRHDGDRHANDSAQPLARRRTHLHRSDARVRRGNCPTAPPVTRGREVCGWRPAVNWCGRRSHASKMCRRKRLPSRPGIRSSGAAIC